jgi:DNA-directed RNA polymerase beta' subunit
MNSYNNEKVLRSEVEETQFGLYTDDDIRKLSVCRVISPITKDALGNPLHGGLYDPRMGVTNISDSNCPTCNYGFVNCPGHPGHIELDHPIYHPLLFDSLFQILKATCLCCKRLRLNDTHIFPYLAKLKLLEMDEITEAEELDSKLWPSHQLDEVFDANTDDENNNGSDMEGGSDNGEDNTVSSKKKPHKSSNAFASSSSSSVIASAAKKKFDVKNNSSSTSKANKDVFEDAQYTLLSDIDERYKRWVNRPNRAIPSVLARNKQRKIINDFMKHCLHIKKCENCDHTTPGIRKDGYTKFFLRTMKSQRYKMSLKNRMKYGNKSAVLFLQDLLKREEDMKEQGIERLTVNLEENDNDHEEDGMDAELEEEEGEGNDDINDDDDDEEDEESEDEGEGGGTARKKKASKVAPSDVFMPHAEVQAIFQLLWKYHGNEGILGHIWGRALRVSAASIEERFNADSGKKLHNYDKEVILGKESWKLFFLSTVFVTPNRFRPEAVIGESAAAHPQNVQLGKIVEINEAMRQLHILERNSLSGMGLPGSNIKGGDDSSTGSTSDGHSDSENSDDESDNGDSKKDNSSSSSSAMKINNDAMTTPVNSGVDPASITDDHMEIITKTQYAINAALNATSATGKANNTSVSANANKSFLSKNLTLLINLQTAVNCYMDGSKDPNPLVAKWGNGIRQILEKKEGLFRKHMMGKRVNYCCRSVISPDPYIGTNEVGIPVHFAKSLHYPVPVTEWNAKHLRTLVERGPFEYPGKELSLHPFLFLSLSLDFFISSHYIVVLPIDSW